MAGRIPQNFIDELLDRTDIVELIGARVHLRKSGRNYTGLCPFHQEKTPSFSVSPDKQFFYCFGCGAGGNAVGFMMDHEHLDFRSAVEELAKRAGLQVPQEASGDPEQHHRQTTLLQQLQRAQHYYQQQLREHPQRNRAVAYLKQRGVTGEIAKLFAIGYAPPGWDNLGAALSQSDSDQQQLIDAGLLVQKERQPTGEQKETYDRFRDRIIFPIRDSRGRTIAFGGRVLGDDKPKYLNSPESSVFSKGRELYGLYEARQNSNRLTRFIIVEGYMDVVALAQHEIFNAVATLGTATSQEHLKKLFRMVPEVVFCFDGDQAGRKAAERAQDIALATLKDGYQVRFMFLPQGEDPDTLVRQEGRDAFLRRADQATPLTDFFFDSLKRQVDTSSMDGKARLSQLALQKLRPMANGVLRQLMLEQLAQLTQLSVERLQAFAAPDNTSSDGYGADSTTRQPTPGRPSRPPRRQYPAHNPVLSPAERATLLLLHHPEFVTQIQPSEQQLAASDARGIELLIAVIQLLRENPRLNPGGILGHWQGAQDQSKREQIARLAATELPVKNQPALQAEFVGAITLLLSHHAEKNLDALLAKARIEPLSDEERQRLTLLLSEKHRPT